MATAQVAIGSDLERKKWMREGLVQAASTSFWGPYTGGSSNAIVYQVNNESAGDGHTVVFDYSGKISGKAVKGKDTAYGKGEIKRKFSDKITVERYRIPVDNGDKFDGKNIGDLTINEHSDSRSKLADLFIRWKDQMIFDALQGGTDTAPSHIYDLGTTFDYDDLISIEDALKTGKGFKTASATGAVTTTAAGRRAPLEPFRLENGEAVWLFIIDSFMATKLKQSTKYQTIVPQADVRGMNNRVISGVIGKLGRLVIVEASDFFGYTDGTGAFGMVDSEVEIAGLRKYTTDGTIDATTPLTGWEGQEAFDTDSATAAKLMSRGLILGQGAVQMAFGKMPDYKFQESTDFGITSQSAVEFWTEAKKTNLKLEGGAVYKAAKISGLDFGVIAVDIKHG
jgi:hypothetical protein